MDHAVTLEGRASEARRLGADDLSADMDAAARYIRDLEGALFAALWLVPGEKLAGLIAEHPVAAEHQPPF